MPGGNSIQDSSWRKSLSSYPREAPPPVSGAQSLRNGFWLQVRGLSRCLKGSRLRPFCLTYAWCPIWPVYIQNIVHLFAGSINPLLAISFYSSTPLKTPTIMYVATLANVFGAAVVLLPLLVSAAPASPQLKQSAPTGPGNQFLGSLTWYPQQPDLILASVSNNSTAHYAILTKNNLFDDLHPYRPLEVDSLSGASVPLVGSRYPYPNIEDAQFRDFPPGTVWERYFNMSAYMPPMPDIKVPESRCFSFHLPQRVEALLIDDNQPSQHLADIFLSKGLTLVELASTPLHQNITVSPGTATPTNGALAAAQTIPAELQAPGVFLPPSVQTGIVVNSLQGLTPIDSTNPSFVINSRKSSSVRAKPE